MIAGMKLSPFNVLYILLDMSLQPLVSIRTKYMTPHLLL